MPPSDQLRSFRSFHFVVGELLEHHCIWSSIPLNAALSLSAFLISSALTYGYSPYSRKLGRWWSRTNLMNDDGVSLPILGETFKILENRVQASRGEDCHCILGVFVEIGVEDAHDIESRFLL